MILLEQDSVELTCKLCVKVINVPIIQNSTSPLEWAMVNYLRKTLALLHGIKSVLTSFGPWKLRTGKNEYIFNALTCIDPVTNLVELICINRLMIRAALTSAISSRTVGYRDTRDAIDVFMTTVAHRGKCR